MVQIPSPRSLLMGHQLRREHFYLLERIDKLEAALLINATNAARDDVLNDEAITTRVKEVLASEHASHLEAQHAMQAEIDEQKKSIVSITLGIHKRLADLEQHRLASEKILESLGAKADVAAVADCNRTVQTVMALVRQSTQELPAVIERLDGLESRLQRVYDCRQHLCDPVKTLSQDVLPGPPVDQLELDSVADPPTFDTSTLVLRDTEDMPRPATTSVTTESVYPSSPPHVATTVVPTMPLSFTKLADEMNHKRHRSDQDSFSKEQTDFPRTQTIDTITTPPPRVVEPQRITRRSRRGKVRTGTLVSALEDPDKMLRKPKAKANLLVRGIDKPMHGQVEAERGLARVSVRQVEQVPARAGVLRTNGHRTDEHPLIARMKARSRLGPASDMYPRLPSST